MTFRFRIFKLLIRVPDKGPRLQKVAHGKLQPRFRTDCRRLGSYLGEGWYGYDRRKYLEVPC